MTQLFTTQNYDQNTIVYTPGKLFSHKSTDRTNATREFVGRSHGQVRGST